MQRTRINFYLSTANLKQLQSMAKREDRTVSDLIRESIRIMLAQEKMETMHKMYEVKGQKEEKPYDV